MRSRGPQMLRKGSETPTQWKSESVTDQPTDGQTGVSAEMVSHLKHDRHQQTDRAIPGVG